MGYIYLIITILTETVAVVCMKFSNGFQEKTYAAVAIIFYAASFIFLTLSLKYLPAGITNATWAGTSTLLVVIASVFLLHEKISVLQMISVIFIVVGLIGLNVQSN